MTGCPHFFFICISQRYIIHTKTLCWEKKQEMCKFKWRLPCVFFTRYFQCLNVSIERCVTVGFRRNIILHKNVSWRERVQNKLLLKVDIMNDNVHRSTNLSNKILLVFISELLFPSVWIFYSFLCFYESNVTINVTLFIKKKEVL